MTRMVSLDLAWLRHQVREAVETFIMPITWILKLLKRRS